MPITFANSQEGYNYVTVTYSGKISDRELLCAWKNFLEGDKWIPGSNVLGVLSSANLSEVTPEGINSLLRNTESFLQQHGRSLKNTKIALYSPTPLQPVLSKLFDSIGIIVAFDDIHEARSWLTSD